MYRKHLVEKDYFDQLQREKSARGFTVYSDTASPQKVANTMTFLNDLALKKIGTRDKAAWLFHNLLRSPAKTIHLVAGAMRGKTLG